MAEVLRDSIFWTISLPAARALPGATADANMPRATIQPVRLMNGLLAGFTRPQSSSTTRKLWFQPAHEPGDGRLQLVVGDLVPDLRRHQDLQLVTGAGRPVRRLRRLVGPPGAADRAVGILLAAQDEQRPRRHQPQHARAVEAIEDPGDDLGPQRPAHPRVDRRLAQVFGGRLVGQGDGPGPPLPLLVLQAVAEA